MTDPSKEAKEVAKANSTNGESAGSMWKFMKKLDTVSATPVILPAGKNTGGFGWPAQYQAFQDPPIADNLATFHKIKTLYNLPEQNPQITIPFSEKDREAWEAKEKMELQKQFDIWIAQHYDPVTDPAQAAWLKKVYPEWFDARIKENKLVHDLQSSYQRMCISGPESKEDLWTLFRASRDPSLADRLNTAIGSGTGVTVSGNDESIINKGKVWRTAVSQPRASAADTTHKPWRAPGGERPALYPMPLKTEVGNAFVTNRHRVGGNGPVPGTLTGRWLAERERNIDGEAERERAGWWPW